MFGFYVLFFFVLFFFVLFFERKDILSMKNQFYLIGDYLSWIVFCIFFLFVQFYDKKRDSFTGV